jgi:acetyl-CoA carboxylase biotin carboxyl carrier protein
MEEDEEKITSAEFAKIREIVEVFNASSFDYLTLELPGMKLTLGTGAPPVTNTAGPPGSGMVSPPAPTAAQTPAGAASQKLAGSTAQSGADAASAPAAAPESDDGSVAVVAPTMGAFYSRPDPSSPPFAEVGASVDADDTVGLIEIMKVFNNVNAGISGIVTEVCVADGEAIEFGQVIMRIRPNP